MARVAFRNSALMALVEHAGKSAVEREADRILSASQMLVPLNKDPRMAWHKGTLQRSGTVEDPDTPAREGHIVKVIRYSVDEAFDYAEMQHETEWFAHETGEHHFLSKKVDEMGDAAKRNIIRSIKAALRMAP